jgi:hypothetical protein
MISGAGEDASTYGGRLHLTPGFPIEKRSILQSDFSENPCNSLDLAGGGNSIGGNSIANGTVPVQNLLILLETGPIPPP